MSPNRHQPKKNPSASVGAGVDEDVGLGRLRRPRTRSSGSHLAATRPHPAGDPKGPHRPTSAALAPTDLILTLHSPRVPASPTAFSHPQAEKRPQWRSGCTA